jgi:hypothetical protein
MMLCCHVRVCVHAMRQINRRARAGAIHGLTPHKQSTAAHLAEPLDVGLEVGEELDLADGSQVDAPAGALDGLEGVAVAVWLGRKGWG